MELLIRTITDKVVIEQPHKHQLGYLIELEKTPFSQYHKLPNFVVISLKDYKLLQVGNKYAQRIK